MKQLTLLLSLISFSVSAQTWQTIPNEHYNVPKYTYGNIISANYSQFELNPHDGTMWFISNNYNSDFDIKRINTDGTMTRFTPSNMPYMDVNSRYFVGIDFSSSKTFLLHEFDGVFSYTGSIWNYDVIFDNGTYACSDADTLYFGRLNQSFVKITESGATFNSPAARRLAVKNGTRWMSGSFYDGIYRVDPSNSSVVFYSPDTCALLDNSNHDFKFARNSDTLYLAGEQGFSLAFEELFVDTITMSTAPNMPYPSIIEFEFDSQDNIWAVFGEGDGSQDYYPLYIGYYDRSMQDWTLIYDAASCPVDFSKRLDIEIDLNDNLWVCDQTDLHVLKINNTPGWLSLVEEETNQFSIFPNPSNGNITIQTEVNVSALEILDVSGRVIKKVPFQTEVQIGEQGTYIIRLLEGEAVVGTRKVVIE